jgi:hypothetical protein
MFPEAGEQSSSPSVHRGSTPKGEGSSIINHKSKINTWNRFTTP